MVINWDKCTIFVQPLTAGSTAPTESGWIKLPTPKEDTTELTTEDGDTLEAREEGGALVDFVQKASTYTLAYGLFQKQGKAHPIKAVNGIVSGDYAVAVQPKDKKTSGIYMGCTSVTANDSYTVSEGGLTTYTHTAKVPEGDANSVTEVDGETVYQQMCKKIITATQTEGAETYTLTFADEA